MIRFQYAGIAVCLLFAGWGIRRLRARQSPGWLSLLAVVLGAMGAVAIYDPLLTTKAAQLLGIGRGADLLTYLIALTFLGSWLYFYHRMRTLSAAVTTLTRELALRDAERPRPVTKDLP
jgi:hypothetical protein